MIKRIILFSLISFTLVSCDNSQEARDEKYMVNCVNKVTKVSTYYTEQRAALVCNNKLKQQPHYFRYYKGKVPNDE